MSRVTWKEQGQEKAQLQRQVKQREYGVCLSGGSKRVKGSVQNNGN